LFCLCFCLEDIYFAHTKTIRVFCSSPDVLTRNFLCLLSMFPSSIPVNYRVMAGVALSRNLLCHLNVNSVMHRLCHRLCKYHAGVLHAGVLSHFHTSVPRHDGQVGKSCTVSHMPYVTSRCQHLCWDWIQLCSCLEV